MFLSWNFVAFCNIRVSGVVRFSLPTVVLCLIHFWCHTTCFALWSRAAKCHCSGCILCEATWVGGMPPSRSMMVWWHVTSCLLLLVLPFQCNRVVCWSHALSFWYCLCIVHSPLSIPRKPFLADGRCLAYTHQKVCMTDMLQIDVAIEGWKSSIHVFLDSIRVMTH